MLLLFGQELYKQEIYAGYGWLLQLLQLLVKWGGGGC